MPGSRVLLTDLLFWMGLTGISRVCQKMMQGSLGSKLGWLGSLMRKRHLVQNTIEELVGDGRHCVCMRV
jgi:hypothetical protein